MILGRHDIPDLVTDRSAGRTSGLLWSAVSARRWVGAEGLDLFRVREDCDGVSFLVAEGACGDDGGAAALEAVEARFSECSPGASGHEAALVEADMDLATSGSDSQASAACVSFVNGETVVTSVGDARVWFFPRDGEPLHLTALVMPRPRIGNSGVPTSLHCGRIGQGTLVAATDGFWVNCSVQEMAVLLAHSEPGGHARTLLAYTYDRQGRTLSDDVAIVTAQVR